MMSEEEEERDLAASTRAVVIVRSSSDTGSFTPAPRFSTSVLICGIRPFCTACTSCRAFSGTPGPAYSLLFKARPRCVCERERERERGGEGGRERKVVRDSVERQSVETVGGVPAWKFNNERYTLH